MVVERSCIWLWSLLLVGLPAQAQVNRCVAADGRIEYRSQPCKDGATGQALTTQATVAKPHSAMPATAQRIQEGNASAQLALPSGSVRFGAPVKPINDPQVPLLTQAPPADLATGAEVILVSGYEPSAGATQVKVDRPGKQVLLVLSSYEKILWRVEPSPGTVIKAILVASYQDRSGVIASQDTRAYLVKLPYAYQADNIQFRQVLARLNAWFGVDKVDAHKGSYSLPSTVEISSLDAPRAELSMAGVQAQAPAVPFGFHLLTADWRQVAWSNAGPAAPVPPGQTLLTEGKVALSPSGQQAYVLVGDGLQVMDRRTRQGVTVPLPTSFPSFSWATDLAYDVDQDIVTVVSLGGEGYLYRYDAKRQRWLDHRSLSNVDITSLAYDPVGKRYVAWTSDGDLLFISNQGKALASKRLRQQLVGFGSTYDGNNGSPPRLTLAPRGHLIALVHFGGRGVNHIWTYDEAKGTVLLTYKDKGSSRP
ncbi:MAG: hypothetical protein C0487_12135 [Leptothrix sp. (in: Bacteria)]|nr:hypothetical protein [Leptothrix sp. (in: b-proteobacteria)]